MSRNKREKFDAVFPGLSKSLPTPSVAQLMSSYYFNTTVQWSTKPEGIPQGVINEGSINRMLIAHMN